MFHVFFCSFLNSQLNEEQSIMEIRPFCYLEVILVTQEVYLMMTTMIMMVAFLDDCQTVHQSLLSVTFDLKAEGDSTHQGNSIGQHEYLCTTKASFPLRD